MKILKFFTCLHKSLCTFLIPIGLIFFHPHHSRHAKQSTVYRSPSYVSAGRTRASFPGQCQGRLISPVRWINAIAPPVDYITLGIRSRQSSQLCIFPGKTTHPYSMAGKSGAAHHSAREYANETCIFTF